MPAKAKLCEHYVLLHGTSVMVMPCGSVEMLLLNLATKQKRYERRLRLLPLTKLSPKRSHSGSCGSIMGTKGRPNKDLQSDFEARA